MTEYKLEVVIDGCKRIATIEALDLDQAILITRVLNPSWIVIGEAKYD